MASGYPASLDTFATTSPTNLGDDDAQARNHAERHDDVGDAMNKVQAELGADPAGSPWSTVASRLLGVQRTIIPAVNDYQHSSTGTSSGLTPTINWLVAIPFFSPIPMTVDRLQVYVETGQTSSVIRLGIYGNTDATDRPGTLLVDGGTVSAAAAGLQAATISQAIPAGLVWLAFAAQTAAGSMQVYQARPYGPAVPGTGNVASDAQSAFYVGSVTGALPGTFGTPAGTQYAPQITVRRSA